MPNGTSGGVGGSEVQTRSLPDLNHFQTDAVGASAGRLTAAAVLVRALGGINRDIG